MRSLQIGRNFLIFHKKKEENPGLVLVILRQFISVHISQPIFAIAVLICYMIGVSY